jgi:hypothetical protein
MTMEGAGDERKWVVVSSAVPFLPELGLAVSDSALTPCCSAMPEKICDGDSEERYT